MVVQAFKPVDHVQYHRLSACTNQPTIAFPPVRTNPLTTNARPSTPRQTTKAPRHEVTHSPQSRRGHGEIQHHKTGADHPDPLPRLVSLFPAVHFTLCVACALCGERLPSIAQHPAPLPCLLCLFAANPIALAGACSANTPHTARRNIFSRCHARASRSGMKRTGPRSSRPSSPISASR